MVLKRPVYLETDDQGNYKNPDYGDTMQDRELADAIYTLCRVMRYSFGIYIAIQLVGIIAGVALPLYLRTKT